MTLREVLMILGAIRDRRDAEFDRERALNHELAVLTSYAYHAPRKMPKFKSAKAKRDTAADEALSQALVRGHFIGLAMHGKKG